MWITDISVKCRTIKLLGGKKRRTSPYPKTRQKIFIFDNKNMTYEKKNCSHQKQKLCFVKDLGRRMKNKLYTVRKYLQKILLTEDLYLEDKMNSQNATLKSSPVRKWTKDMETFYQRRYKYGR